MISFVLGSSVVIVSIPHGSSPGPAAAWFRDGRIALTAQPFYGPETPGLAGSEKRLAPFRLVGVEALGRLLPVPMQETGEGRTRCDECGNQ